MNSFSGMGRLTRDPELHYTSNGTAVCELRLALNRRWRDKSTNETREKATFVDVVFWRGAAETVASHFHKGKMIAFQGYLNQEEWEDSNGQKRSKLKVVADEFHFCGDAPREKSSIEEGQRPQDAWVRSPPPAPPPIAPAAFPKQFKDTDVPF